MVVIRLARADESKAALGLIMHRPGSAPAEVDAQIRALFRYCGRHALSLDNLLLAERGDQMVAACLCVDSPGRTSAVFLPSINSFTGNDSVYVQLLEQSALLAEQRNIVYLQGMVADAAQAEAGVYQRGDFSFLARLLHLESDLTQPVLADKPFPPLTWVTYENATHDLFARTVEATYQDSLDCSALTGVRQIEDILAAHRSTGEFDPRYWYVALVEGAPAGVLLLAHVPERCSYEVVYMGVLPRYRGSGCGSAFLRRSVETARDQAVMKLTLTVDEQNAPARRLYEHFGFREVARRDAWIRILTEPYSGK